MIDYSVCKFWCIGGLVGWLLVNAYLFVWLRGATKLSKEYEEDHGNRYSTDNGNSVEKEAEAFSKLGL